MNKGLAGYQPILSIWPDTGYWNYAALYSTIYSFALNKKNPLKQKDKSIIS